MNKNEIFSFDVQIILGKIPNPVALVNFYLFRDFWNQTIDTFDRFRRNLDTCLNDSNVKIKIDILQELKNFEILNHSDSISVESNIFFRNLSLYLNQYTGLNDSTDHRL